MAAHPSARDDAATFSFYTKPGAQEEKELIALCLPLD